MKFSCYPYGEFTHCNPDCPNDQFASRTNRYARAMRFILEHSGPPLDKTTSFDDIEEQRLAYLQTQFTKLSKVTALGCSTVDEVLTDGEQGGGWSIGGLPLLIGVAHQLEQITNPDVSYARKTLSRSSKIIETRLNRPTLEVFVYDSWHSGRLSTHALRNASLMAALAAPTLRYDLPTLHSTTAAEPFMTALNHERVSIVSEQRERSVHTGMWMLAAANFGTFSMQQVRRTLIDLALSLDDGAAARDIFALALNASRSELIAYSERVAGSLA